MNSGNISISNEPLIIGTSLMLANDTTVVLHPSNETTIFLVVEGTAAMNNTFVLDMSGRNYDATMTILAVVRAGEILDSASDQRVVLQSTPKSSSLCSAYSASAAKSTTAMNLMVTQDNSNCEKSGPSRIVTITVVASVIATGVVRVTTCLVLEFFFWPHLLQIFVFVVLLLLRFGICRRSDSAFLAEGENWSETLVK